MSRSWKVKNGPARRRKSSKATSALCSRLLHRVAARGVPRALEGVAAEGIEPRPDEAVPVADGEAEVVGHLLAEDLAGRGL
jgi:hypothetical protein